MGSLPEDINDAPLDGALPFLLSEEVVALGGQDLVHEVVSGAQREVEEATAVVGAAKFHRMLRVYGVHARVKNGFPCLNYQFPPPEIFRQIIQRLIRFPPTDNNFLSRLRFIQRHLLFPDRKVVNKLELFRISGQLECF